MHSPQRNSSHGDGYLQRDRSGGFRESLIGVVYAQLLHILITVANPMVRAPAGRNPEGDDDFVRAGSIIGFVTDGCSSARLER
jgi:hypothetical protein